MENGRRASQHSSTQSHSVGGSVSNVGMVAEAGIGARRIHLGNQMHIMHIMGFFPAMELCWGVEVTE